MLRECECPMSMTGAQRCPRKQRHAGESQRGMAAAIEGAIEGAIGGAIGGAIEGRFARHHLVPRTFKLMARPLGAYSLVSSIKPNDATRRQLLKPAALRYMLKLLQKSNAGSGQARNAA